MRRVAMLAVALGILGGSLLLAGAGGTAGSRSAKAARVVITQDDLAAFKPLPRTMADKAHPAIKAEVDLGRMLYYDPRLSGGHDLSCNSCHDLARYGVDPNGGAVSEGHKGKKGSRNAPTVYNAAGDIAQFWDGRAKDVEAQAGGPMLNPVEMAMPGPERVVRTLKSIPGYVKAFHAAYPKAKDPVTFEHVGQAIGAFERGLTTPSRFDAFLRGNHKALTEQEKRGLKTFVELGCTACHNGPYVGGGSFQVLGVVHPYPDQTDLGRETVTKNPDDRMVFKVPSLRNVTMTAPYFHSGHIKSLREAVRTMAHYQLGFDKLTRAQMDDIIAFLGSLKGTLPKGYIARPALPPSGPATPKPVDD